MEISCNGRHCLLVVLLCLYGAVHDVCLLFLAALYVGTIRFPHLPYIIGGSLLHTCLCCKQYLYSAVGLCVIAGFLSMLCALLDSFLFALLNCAMCQWYLFLGSCPCGI